MAGDPHIWWYVTRASAILAWVLMTASVLWGVLLSTRILRRIDDAAKLRDLHRFLGGLGLVFALLHVGSLLLDPWLAYVPLDVLVPLHSAFRPWPVALGILGLYLLIAVYASSLLRDRLPHGVWKAIHVGNYAAVLLVAFHAGLTGTDVGRWWYLALATTIIALTGAAVVIRLLLVRRPGVQPAPTEATASGASGAPARAAVLGSSGPGAALPVRAMTVAGVVDAADGVRALRLASLDGELPPWEPGAHIALRVPGIGPRHYSLCGDPADRFHYDIAVLREPDSRGGSIWVHARRPGDLVEVEEPRNHFRLVAASSYLFIAGGIGITPLKAMLESLPERRDWRLWYLGRSRATMAFLPELLARHPGRIAVYARDEHDRPADVVGVAAAWEGELFCCGPQSLSDAVLAAGRPGHTHVERFAPVALSALPARAVRVDARRSGVNVDVAADRSILEALEAQGLPVSASCRRGVCGACEVRVLSGRPEHLDSVLPHAEADELGVMYPCVSRSLDERLVLDL